MSIFDDIIGKNADDRLAEEMLYAEAMREIEQGIRRDGLWGKAIADSDGEETKAKAQYLNLRVQALKDELQKERQAIEEVAIEKKKSEKKKNVEDGIRSYFSFIGVILVISLILAVMGSLLK